ncbi:Armadillo-type fold [Arabidopsis thaliana x Arabidopsis arenosa]|uniref:Armadillo-type fold n=1 Tax=Arabidopsis thaliana x Arabidopsis arenosa TaxID=1240361 RepID=A0A8T2BI83_9BRAS|nr:Armadillo-type fold [Arabidopsis thaliana x Arabidopsis arenosa]
MFSKCFNDSHPVKECLSRVCRFHGDPAAAHVSRTIADIVKQLKDSSTVSGVRDACDAGGDTIGALSRIYLNSDDAVVVQFVEPLFEAMRDRRKGVQSGAALCMARMVLSAATPPISSFQKLCPRICELLSNPCFLAQASLLLVVSSLSQVGAIAPQSLDSLLERIHACLASTCWETRKAAADTLTALASHSSSLIYDKTDFTLAVLENRAHEMIKAVRESVTEALQLWKNISGKCVDGASDDSKIASGELLGSERNGKQRLMSISDIESAYEEAFGTNDQGLIISLMKKTGPIFDRLLSIKIAHKIIKFISQLLEDHNHYDMCVDWIRELQEQLARSGIATFGDPRKLKRKILYNLQQAGQRRMDPSIPKLIVKLADSWSVDIQIKVTV